MRLFVAIDIGDVVRAEVARARATIQGRLEAVAHPPRVAWVAPVSLHLTLRFLGEVADTAVPALRDLLADPFELAPFEIEWRGLGAFPLPRHPKALWMGVVSGAALLGRLEAEVSKRLDGAIDAEPGPFRPHLTIGRVKAPGAGIDWVEMLESVDVRGARSLVDHVTLYQSKLSAKGPQYTGLVKAPLLR
ncbi:MAG: RNA 2',3'-cyclic phosphodiesterase [Vicinamibacterales bacterium]